MIPTNLHHNSNLDNDDHNDEDEDSRKRISQTTRRKQYFDTRLQGDGPVLKLG
jgi:hypothetical protein